MIDFIHCFKLLIVDYALNVDFPVLVSLIIKVESPLICDQKFTDFSLLCELKFIIQLSIYKLLKILNYRNVILNRISNINIINL